MSLFPKKVEYPFKTFDQIQSKYNNTKAYCQYIQFRKNNNNICWFKELKKRSFPSLVNPFTFKTK